MKLFECQHCGQPLYFENTRCESCGRNLGYLPTDATISALEEGKRIHCEYAVVVQASEWSVERDSRVALWFRLISDDQSPRHVLVAAPAEDVTREGEFSRLVWREHHASDFARLDLGGELEIREAESMDPV